MAKINLLPWREEYRLEKKKEFYTQLFGLGVLVGLSLMLWYSSVDRMAILQDFYNDRF